VKLPLAAAGRIAKSLRRRSVLPVRFLIDQALARIDNPDARLRLALVSDEAVYTSEQQFNPFDSYRSDLRSRLGVISLRLHLSDVLLAPRFVLAPFDIVIVKLGFRTPPQTAGRLITIIREATPAKTLIYFDGDDDLCVQWPDVLAIVDLYVKKHAFRDRNKYLQQYVGKSNLTDYVHRQFGHSFNEDSVTSRTDALPTKQIQKLLVGWNLALDNKITDLRSSIGLAGIRPRCNDIVCRAGVPNDWIRYLRKDVEPTLRRLGHKYRVITPNQRVATDVYLREMLDSKICFSPFGYGEICWRDFEAILCGCLLVKPDMSHVETYPEIFQPYRTYVPVHWDLSNLEEVCIYYLTHDDERERIASAAQSVLREFYDQHGFLKRADAVLSRAGIQHRAPL
jgi:hypothetical protein